MEWIILAACVLCFMLGRVSKDIEATAGGGSWTCPDCVSPRNLTIRTNNIELLEKLKEAHIQKCH